MSDTMEAGGLTFVREDPNFWVWEVCVRNNKRVIRLYEGNGEWLASYVDEHRWRKDWRVIHAHARRKTADGAVSALMKLVRNL